MRQKLDENRIYEIALRQFAQFGYKKATLEDIASELNMTGASLYSYASSKLELYHDSVSYILKKWEQYVLDELQNAKTASEFMEIFFTSSIAYLNGNPTFRTLLKKDPGIISPSNSDCSYEKVISDLFEKLRAAIAKGTACGEFCSVDAGKCADAMGYVFKHVIIDAYVRDEFDGVIEALPEMIKLLLNGLKTR